MAAHGGNAELVVNPSKMLKSKFKLPVASNKSGYVTQLDAYSLAKLVNHIQVNTEEGYKNYVGVKMLVDINSYVHVGQSIAELHLNSKKLLSEYSADLLNCVKIAKRKTKQEKLIVKIINK